MSHCPSLSHDLVGTNNCRFPIRLAAFPRSFLRFFQETFFDSKKPPHKPSPAGYDTTSSLKLKCQNAGNADLLGSALPLANSRAGMRLRRSICGKALQRDLRLGCDRKLALEVADYILGLPRTEFAMSVIFLSSSCGLPSETN